MAKVVDWCLDAAHLRKELLKLSKSNLIKACKFKNIQYNGNKKYTVNQLISRRKKILIDELCILKDDDEFEESEEEQYEAKVNDIHINLYRKKLILLIAGYYNQIMCIYNSNVSTIYPDLTEIIGKYHSCDPQLIINKLLDDDKFLFECYIQPYSDEVNKILNINKYIFYDNDSPWKSKIKSLFYKNNCIAFGEYTKSKLYTERQEYFRNHRIKFWVHAIDNNDNILITSNELLLNPIIMARLQTSFQIFGDSFQKLFDVNNKGSIKLNEWLLSLNTLNLGFDELLYVRIFHYMSFIKNHCNINPKVLDIDQNDFKEFLKNWDAFCVEEYNNFAEEIYHKCVKSQIIQTPLKKLITNYN